MTKHQTHTGSGCPPCDKTALRRLLRARRDALEPQQAAQSAAAAQRHLLRHPVWQSAKQVLLYMPVRNETATDLLLHDAWQQGKSVLLPRCIPDCPGEMCLAPCACAADLVTGQYGIAEPDPATCPAVDVTGPSFAPQVAVIPGVGFDRAGNRLGFGAGYYDRFLALPAMQSAALVGLAYPFQITDSLPSDPWDRPVNALCTEEGLLWL
ncbi:5-formyltetrahydrofolate cyclo-ligase [Oleidesulfovibrio alaskensis]|jgi:5-formyltetrahydrofolate cyclo-ligase